MDKNYQDIEDEQLNELLQQIQKPIISLLHFAFKEAYQLGRRLERRKVVMWLRRYPATDAESHADAIEQRSHL